MIATVVAARTMPSLTADQSDSTLGHTIQTYTLPSRTLSDKSLFGSDYTDKLHHGPPHAMNGRPANGSVMQSMPNGRPSHAEKRTSQQNDSSVGGQRAQSGAKQAPVGASGPQRLNSGEPAGRDDGYFASVYSGEEEDSGNTTHVSLNATSPPSKPSTESQQPHPHSNLQIPGSTYRVSSPPAFNHTTSPAEAPYRLQHRHTLEVPSVSAARAQGLRNHAADDVVTPSGRFSPVNTPTRRRGSMSLARRATRSIHSDMHLDEVPQDEDVARWAEHIRQKRASKRKRRDDDDDDRVVVGTKVDQNHVNWVTAYNMLTGIRFTVSRTNAKMDRDLTDADFDAKHKFSFDMYVPEDFSLSNLLFLFGLSCDSPKKLVCNGHHANEPTVPEMNSRHPQNTTSSSRTTRPGSSAIFATPSASIPPTTSCR
jgi:1-phosphatidylinositol-4-phosphate 5-kinase